MKKTYGLQQPWQGHFVSRLWRMPTVPMTAGDIPETGRRDPMGSTALSPGPMENGREITAFPLLSSWSSWMGT